MKLQIIESQLSCYLIKQDVKEWRDFTLGPLVINQFLKSIRVDLIVFTYHLESSFQQFYI